MNDEPGPVEQSDHAQFRIMTLFRVVTAFSLYFTVVMFFKPESATRIEFESINYFAIGLFWFVPIGVTMAFGSRNLIVHAFVVTAIFFVSSAIGSTLVLPEPNLDGAFVAAYIGFNLAGIVGAVTEDEYRIQTGIGVWIGCLFVLICVVLPRPEFW